MKLYRKYTRKIAWLANSTRPDLCYLALQILKKNQGATISDLRDINHIIKKVREKKRPVKYEHLGDADDLVIIRIGDASYKQDEKAVGGIFLFLANSSLTHAAPIFWKAKQIDRVCHISKDAETINLLKMLDDAVLAAR